MASYKNQEKKALAGSRPRRERESPGGLSACICRRSYIRHTAHKLHNGREIHILEISRIKGLHKTLTLYNCVIEFLEAIGCEDWRLNGHLDSPFNI